MLNVVIDLSHHNTVSSFQDAKDNGIVGIIHKATENTGFVDATYSSRRVQALSKGLLWGAYHFAARGHVEAQVNHFLDTVEPEATDLIALDFEPNAQAGTMTLAEAEQFVTLVHQKIGRYPGLYSAAAFLKEKLGNTPPADTVLSNCFLWLAKFSNGLPAVPPAFPTFTFWQYTDGNNGDQPHQVPGIGRCDRDKFNGDLDGLKRLWGV